ncbi:MAG TPA: hypothetical protein VNW47_14360 [Terriglobales bacterium]|nr:hypothetical protein [Terriglobales bacterium]
MLPAKWNGCKIVEETWRGYTEAGRGEETVARGPAIRVVNPQSKESDQYGDIYIMIFTHKQWHSLQEGKFIVGAAPISPSELDPNTKYVFAEPPRMINPDLGGAEEIQNIMKDKPLHAF